MTAFDAEALFFDPDRHFEALALLAAASLRRGENAAAFRYADRLCRLREPSTEDRLLHSEACRRAGFIEEAADDLRRALEQDPTDRAVLRRALKWGAPEQKSVVAALLAREDGRRSAFSQRPRAKEPPGPDQSQPTAVHHEAPAPLSIIIPVYEDFDATRGCFEALFAQDWDEPVRIIAVDDASPNAALALWLDAQAAAGRLVLLRNAANAGFAASVNRALALCGSGDVVLLNADALPPPGGLARLAAVARSAPEIGTVTPLSNNGEYCSFPAPNVANPLPEAEEVARIDRLARKANGAAFVDLPNGIGFCLYITRACLDAVGPLPEIYARGYFEDVEFCLRAREKGFRNVCAVGVYVGHAGARSFGAGKRQLVMRNLAVLERRFPHYPLESASFLDADPLRDARAAIELLAPPTAPTVLLVCVGGAARFLAEERARELAAEGAAPLICAWAPDGQVSLRGAADAWPQSLSFRLQRPESYRALLDYLRAAALARIEMFDPLSLPFSLLSPLFRLGARVDLAGGDLQWALALRQPFDGACRKPRGDRVCRDCATGVFTARDEDGARAAHFRRKRTLLARARAIRPLDRMAAAFVLRYFGESVVAGGDEEAVPAPLPRRDEPGVLAVVMPLPDPLADRLVVALGRVLRGRKSAARLVVFGACVNDLAVMATGNVFVAGAARTEEYERLLRQYGAAALMSPYRTRFFGLGDRLSRRFGLPHAYFDYSTGRLPQEAEDLALDLRLCDAKAAARIANWLAASPLSLGVAR